MTITHQEWPWYVAEYVLSETKNDGLISYSIHSYLLHADGAEAAYAKAVSLQARLDDAIRDDNGDPVEYRCIGIHNLDTLQVTEIENGTHLSVINWYPTTMPPIRAKHELSLFLSD